MRRYILLPIALLLALASCRSADAKHEFSVPRDTPGFEVANTFIDVVQEMYAERDDGSLSTPIMGGKVIRFDFSYGRMSEAEAVGERIELVRTSLDRKRYRDREARTQSHGEIEIRHAVIATYNTKGINPPIPDLASEIAAQVLDRLGQVKEEEQEQEAGIEPPSDT